MTKQHKIITIALSILGVGGFGLGIYQIYSNVYGPFRSPIKSVTEISTESKVASLDYILSLQKKDGDSDGLSDYKELYTYGTSPYLKDTDADGLDDKTELEQGTDPLCHQYKDCTGLNIEKPIEGGLEETVPNYPEIQTLPTVGTPGIPSDPTNMSAENIRAILKENGMSQDKLGNLTDQDLLDAWQEVVSQTQGQP